MYVSRKTSCHLFILISTVTLLVCLVRFSSIAQAPQSNKSQPSQKEVKKMTDPFVFSEIPLNTFVRTKCSPPKPEEAWQGVVIRAPQKVAFKRGVRVGETGAFAAIPICGFSLLMVQFPLVEDVIQLVAMNKKTGKVYMGQVIDLDPSPLLPLPELPPVRKEDVERMASGGYFNPNLADFVDIPEAAGVYEVFVEIRGNRSNVVTIEIIEGELN
jgi:hypothetical protein